ncbi:glycosyltransferase [Candidatus Woesebacteria bacterium]|nr:glycosyltransferase [Candidatus Woesebacteria bacterium]
MRPQEEKSKKIRLLSVVIPAYRAERIIEKTLLEIKGVLDQTRYNYEIICVVDGRVDGTFEEAKKLENLFPRKVRVVSYERNLGKGHAVRFGMAKAKGDVIGFVDAGIELNPNGLGMLLEHLEWYSADIIVGSKRHPASKVIYPWQRKLLSFGYQLLTRIFFGLSVKDTQVGMKFFRREVLKKVLPRLLVKDFAFDIELLSVANYLGFRRIFEAPVEIKMKFGGVSTIASKGFVRTVWRMLWDTLAVFYRLYILNYYDYKNRKNWITPNYLTFKNSQ